MTAARLPAPEATAEERRRIAAAASRAGVSVKDWLTAVVSTALEADERYHRIAPEARSHPSAARLRAIQDGISRGSLGASMLRIPRLR